jgi:hypothetical protein
VHRVHHACDDVMDRLERPRGLYSPAERPHRRAPSRRAAANRPLHGSPRRRRCRGGFRRARARSI